MEPKDQTVKQNLAQIEKKLAECGHEALTLYEGVAGNKAVQAYVEERGLPKEYEPMCLVDQAASLVAQVDDLMDLLLRIRLDLGVAKPQS